MSNAVLDGREFLARNADPVVLGLERKLDVLRAQLAAAQAGEDPGAAGISAWSGLEVQAQRISELERIVGELRQQVQVARDERDAAQAKLRRAVATAAVEAERARQEVVSSHRTIASLGRALDEVTRADAAPVERAKAEAAHAVQPAAVDSRLLEEAALYRAVLVSTSWRVTRPLRQFSAVIRGKRPRRDA